MSIWNKLFAGAFRLSLADFLGKNQQTRAFLLRCGEELLREKPPTRLLDAPLSLQLIAFELSSFAIGLRQRRSAVRQPEDSKIPSVTTRIAPP